MTVVTPNGHGLGYRPDDPAHPDAQRPFTTLAAVRVPPTMDLRSEMPAVYDQGQVGSCTANAVCALVGHQRLAQGLKPFTPSRLFNYWFSRKRLGIQGADDGSTISCAAASAAAEGVCSEDGPAGSGRWLYDPTAVETEPDAAAVFAAHHHRATEASKVPVDSYVIMNAIAAHSPVAFGCLVYASFESLFAAGGLIPLPAPGETLLGGHAMVIVGYDEARQKWLVRNSWGAQWGDGGGHCWLPFAYLINDLWIIRKEDA